MQLSVATNSRLTTETTRVKELIPEAIGESAGNLIGFLEEYYRFMSQATAPTGVINDIFLNTEVKATSDIFIDRIQNEIAKNVPNSSPVDRPRLYAKLNDFYNLKGTSKSIELFFRVFFNEIVSVYFPKEDLFKLSAGDWTGTEYNDKNGFLSNIKRLHDGNYWQEYSYEITSGITTNRWLDDYIKLVHPAGLKLFAALIIEISRSSIWNEFIDYSSPTENDLTWLSTLRPPWLRIVGATDGYHVPRYQPGWLEGNATSILVLIKALLEDPDPRIAAAWVTLNHIAILDSYRDALIQEEWDTKGIKSYDTSPIGSWFDSIPMDVPSTITNVGSVVEDNDLLLSAKYVINNTSNSIIGPNVTVVQPKTTWVLNERGVLTPIAPNTARLDYDSSTGTYATATFGSTTVNAKYKGSFYNGYTIAFDEGGSSGAVKIVLTLGVDNENLPYDSGSYTLMYTPGYNTESEMVSALISLGFSASTTSPSDLMPSVGNHNLVFAGGADLITKGILVESASKNYLYGHRIGDQYCTTTNVTISGHLHTGSYLAPVSEPTLSIVGDSETINTDPINPFFIDIQGDKIESTSGSTSTLAFVNPFMGDFVLSMYVWSYDGNDSIRFISGNDHSQYFDVNATKDALVLSGTNTGQFQSSGFEYMGHGVWRIWTCITKTEDAIGIEITPLSKYDIIGMMLEEVTETVSAGFFAEPSSLFTVNFPSFALAGPLNPLGPRDIYISGISIPIKDITANDGLFTPLTSNTWINGTTFIYGVPQSDYYKIVYDVTTLELKFYYGTALEVETLLFTISSCTLTPESSSITGSYTYETVSVPMTITGTPVWQTTEDVNSPVRPADQLSFNVIDDGEEWFGIDYDTERNYGSLISFYTKRKRGSAGSISINNTLGESFDAITSYNPDTQLVDIDISATTLDGGSGNTTQTASITALSGLAPNMFTGVAQQFSFTDREGVFRGSINNDAPLDEIDTEASATPLDYAMTNVESIDIIGIDSHIRTLNFFRSSTLTGAQLFSSIRPPIQPGVLTSFFNGQDPFWISAYDYLTI